jgi:hypothetical protein
MFRESRIHYVSVVVLAAALVLAPLCREALAQAPASATQASGRLSDGIEVHGHWKIDVRNADGTLVSHTEFHNELLPSGGNVLVNVLAGTEIPAGWLISLSGTPGGAIAFGAASVSPVADGAATALRLTAELRNDGFTLPLGGSVPPLQAIGSVATVLRSCSDATVSPTACRLSSPNQNTFSSRTLNSPIPVAAGQIIQVTVDISFRPST